MPVMWIIIASLALSAVWILLPSIRGRFPTRVQNGVDLAIVLAIVCLLLAGLVQAYLNRNLAGVFDSYRRNAAVQRAPLAGVPSEMPLSVSA